MATLVLPETRPLVWPLRPSESAESSIVRSAGGVVITIRHEILRGVSPEMLAWWYRHVPGTMTYAGKSYPRYLVWHPLDHISYDVVRPAPEGGVGPTAKLQIKEALGRDPTTVIDIQVRVVDIDEHQAVIAKEVLGTSIVRLENEFERTRAGTRYTTRMRIGDDTFLGQAALNRIGRTRIFPPRKIQRWIRHHIEEIGNLENFLPNLFRTRVDHEP
jgi:hypothetical protein